MRQTGNAVPQPDKPPATCIGCILWRNLLQTAARTHEYRDATQHHGDAHARTHTYMLCCQKQQPRGSNTSVPHTHMHTYAHMRHTHTVCVFKGLQAARRHSQETCGSKHDYYTMQRHHHASNGATTPMMPPHPHTQNWLRLPVQTSSGCLLLQPKTCPSCCAAANAAGGLNRKPIGSRLLQLLVLRMLLAAAQAQTRPPGVAAATAAACPTSSCCSRCSLCLCCVACCLCS